MNIRSLQYITAVANEGSFTKAANKVFVSQPTLTMQIQKLEEELGVQLFERKKKKFLITDAGNKIIEKAHEVLRKTDEIKEIAKNYENPFSGDLKIGAFPTLASYYFPRITDKILKNFPQLTLLLIEEKTQDLIEKLRNGEIDCCFLASPLHINDFEEFEIFEEEFLLAVNKKHTLSQEKKPISNTQLRNESLLLLEDGHCLRDQALEACNLMSNIKTRSDFSASSLETLIQMVELNAGITLIPEIAARKSKDIKYLELATKPTRKIGFYFRKGSVRETLFDGIVSELSR